MPVTGESEPVELDAAAGLAPGCDGVGRNAREQPPFRLAGRALGAGRG